MAIFAPVAALLAAVLFLVMGNGLQTTLLPLRAGLESFGAVNVGIMGSAYFVGFVAGCLLQPFVIRRSGHIRTFAAMVSLASCVAIAHPLLVDPYAWWVLRAITGFCFAGLYLIVESWLNERATNETRGMVMSGYIFINYTAISVGQILIVLHDPSSFPLFSLASILVSLAAVPVALTTAQQPAPPAVVRLRPIRLFRASPAGVMGCFLIGVTNGAFWSLGVVAATGAGMAINEAAFFMSAAVICGALAQYPVGRMSDRLDRRLVIIGVCGAAAVAGAVLALIGAGRPDLLLFLGAVFGAAALPVYAVCAAHAFDFVEPDGYVETSAGLLLLNGIGSVIGPLGAATVMQRFGPLSLFLFTAAVHVSLALFVAFRMTRRATLSTEEKTNFDLPSATAVVVTPMAPEEMPPDADVPAEPGPEELEPEEPGAPAGPAPG